MCVVSLLLHEEIKTVFLPVTGSQREPVSPTLSGGLPHRALTSVLFYSHSGPAAVSGTEPSWLVLSSGHCLYQRDAEYRGPTTLWVWGCHWCTDTVEFHSEKSLALQGDFCWVPALCPGGRQKPQTSLQCVWSESSGPACSIHCGFVNVFAQVHAEVNLSSVVAAVMEKYYILCIPDIMCFIQFSFCIEHYTISSALGYNHDDPVKISDDNNVKIIK